jgi:hypothetical protein
MNKQPEEHEENGPYEAPPGAAGLIIDIETWAAAEDDPAWVAERAVLSQYPGAPKNYKTAEALSKHEAEWYASLEVTLEAKRAETALNPLLGRISVIGYGWVNDAGTLLSGGVIDATVDVGYALKELEGLFDAAPGATLITYNGSKFDLPFLAVKAARHSSPFVLKRLTDAMRDRFGQRRHVDLATVIPMGHTWNIPFSLTDVLRGLNLPTFEFPDEVSGAQLATCFDVEAVKQHCFADIKRTAAYLQPLAFAGSVELIMQKPDVDVLF